MAGAGTVKVMTDCPRAPAPRSAMLWLADGLKVKRVVGEESGAGERAGVLGLKLMSRGRTRLPASAQGRRCSRRACPNPATCKEVRSGDDQGPYAFSGWLPTFWMVSACGLSLLVLGPQPCWRNSARAAASGSHLRTPYRSL